MPSRPGGDERMTFLSGFKETTPQYEIIPYSEQGAVYVFKALNEMLPIYSITRSILRAGIPADKAAMESINGWIKAGLFVDYCSLFKKDTR